jgi:hypothetical protein
LVNREMARLHWRDRDDSHAHGQWACFRDLDSAKRFNAQWRQTAPRGWTCGPTANPDYSPQRRRGRREFRSDKRLNAKSLSGLSRTLRGSHVAFLVSSPRSPRLCGEPEFSELRGAVLCIHN